MNLPETLDTNERLNLLVRAGVLLLENGAATYRVDETLKALGRALELGDIEVFTTPTGFTLQAGGSSCPLTRVHRITHVGVDMNRLAAVNNLSREALSKALTPEQIADHLSQIEQQRSIYPAWLLAAGVSISCGAFGMLMGGGWTEFVAGVLGALAAMLIRLRLRRTLVLPLMVTVVTAFVATAVSRISCHALHCTSPDLASVAAVLQLVPGVPMVTSVLDLATGDILSGVTRGAYAALMAVGIALGMLLFLVWGLR